MIESTLCENSIVMNNRTHALRGFYYYEKNLPAVTFRGHLYVYLCKKAEECGYEKDLAGRG